MPLRDPCRPSTGISQPFAQPSEKDRSPEDDLTLWQWMTVEWMTPLIKVGNARQLQPGDVWSLPYEFQHHHLHQAFRALKGTVVKRLLRANWHDLVALTFFSFVELTADYSSPLLLQNLLKSMDLILSDKGPAVFYAVLTLLVRYVSIQSSVLSMWFCRRAYERARGEMITMIHEKTLNRKIIGAVTDKPDVPKRTEAQPAADGTSNVAGEGAQQEPDENSPLLNGSSKASAKPENRWLLLWQKAKALLSFRKFKDSPPGDTGPASIGKILNMMRGDVYEVAQRFWDFSSLIEQPFGFAISFTLVWRLLGWPCLFGVAVVVIAQILNVVLVKVLVKWETVRRQATDTKLKQISQYIEAIRHLRYYAWHNTWLDRIMTARQKELNLKIITSLWRVVVLFVNIMGSGVLPLAAFWAYTSLKGERLTVDIAFPALQLFGLLQMNLQAIPRLINVLLDAYVAVGRIEDFMQEPDKDESENDCQSFGEELETKDAYFAWPGISRPVLKDVTLQFPNGLTVIYGQVASGKSALLQALLGELDLQAGELRRPSTAIAYCSQTPWLQSMSIRENILFGGPYDETRYKQTLHACALVQDFASFEHGDLSPIGENGIGLSGGQKMRVALARAVYSRANTLLLDDPLSALDQQTAEHIVQLCFRGDLLKGRTLLLVTHRVDLCAHLAEQLVEIAHGAARVRDVRQVDLPEYALSPSASHQQHQEDERDGTKDESVAVPEKFEDEEHRVHGGVQAKVYWEYIKAGRLPLWFAVFASSALCRVFMFAQSWFLKEWSEAYKDVGLKAFVLQDRYIAADGTSTPLSRLFDRFPDPAKNPNPWLLGFFVLVMFDAFSYVMAMIFSTILTYISGKRIFKDVMVKVSNTTFRYYDVTPVGRLMNRLTSDMGTVDGDISGTFVYCAWQIISWVTSVSVIAFITPLFLVAGVMLTLSFVYIFLQFIPTSQSLRRLEMVSLSPLMSNFGALLEGLMTVRAFCVQKEFQDRIIRTTDAFQQMDHFYWSLQAWLTFRLDLLSAVSTLILTFLAIYSDLSPGLTAFVLIAAGKFVQSTHALCRQYGSLQLEFVAVERVVELNHLDQESQGSERPPAFWPSTDDSIVFENVSIRYAPNLPAALENISVTIPGGSSVAVIGRTGSGKSTFALSLLATTVPSSGRVTIGGVDLSSVDKQALRGRVTFLAQEPVLFPGSLRHNLDPVEEHTDEECAAVLERVCGRYGFTLETEVDAGGKNLSQGQRQLVGLARAILRRSAVVIMDEATASIDRETAWEIQRVLREELKGSTVVTIAHREEAVRGAEWCLRLKDGKVESFTRTKESSSSRVADEVEVEVDVGAVDDA